METNLTHTLFFKDITKNKKIYWIVDDYGLKMTLNGAQFDYKNLFNGNKLLGDNILRVMNENWREIADSLVVGVEKAYIPVLKALANQIFTKIPINNIFLM